LTNLKYCYGICLEQLRKAMKNLSGLVSVPGKIQISQSQMRGITASASLFAKNTQGGKMCRECIRINVTKQTHQL
jgi:hypothetical protein